MLEKLTRFPLFKDLSSADLKIIAPYFIVRTYEPGTIIIEQGAKATYLYLLTVGEVETHYKPYDGESIKLTSLYAGNAFGWSAVLGNHFYSSSVISAANCEVLIISGEDLRCLRKEHPQTGAVVMDCLARTVSRRWVSAQTQVKSMIRKGVVENISPLGKKEQDT